MDDMYTRQALRTRVYKAKMKRYGEVLCYCCNEPVSFAEASLEHVVPTSQGGHPTDIKNLDISHVICNTKRGNLRGVYRYIGKAGRT